MRFLIEAGHQGTVGAVGGGLIEEDIVKVVADKVVKYLIEQGHQAEEANFNIYDKIETERGVSLDLRRFNYILSLHLNSFKDILAKGTEFWIPWMESNRAVAVAVSRRMAKYFLNRGVKQHDSYAKDLFVLKKLKEAGRQSGLLEICFISNAQDRATLLANLDAIAKDIAYGILEGLGQPIKVIMPTPISQGRADAPYGKIYALRTGSLKSGKNADALRETAIKAGFKDAYLELVDYSKEK